MKSLGWFLVSIIVTSAVSVALVSVLASTMEIQTLIREFSPTGSMSIVLALFTIFLKTDLFANLTTAAVWWFIGGIVTGFIINIFKRGMKFPNWLLVGIFTPIVVGLTIGSIVDATVPGYAGYAGYLATRNIIGGILSAIGADLGVRANQIIFASRIAKKEEAIRQELYHSEIEPIRINCPKCDAVLHSNALSCSFCGTPLSSSQKD